MRSRSLAAQHDAAVARRLELLTDELAAVRGGARVGAAGTRPRLAESWTPHEHTRIRSVPGREPSGRGPVGEPAEGAVPSWEAAVARSPAVARLPGRHASRRAARSPGSGWVADQLRARVALGAGQLAVLAVVAAVGLAVTCWWLVRSGAHEVPAPVALTTPQAALATPEGARAAADASAAPATRAKVVVDVTGRVRRPGIVVLRQGARVVDAVRAASGSRSREDLSSLNLARVLTDGEQIVVGSTVAVGPPVPASAATAAPGETLVNLNTADQTALESLPEVGPVTAQAILAWRTEHGGFTSIDQLLDVDGIGDATLAQLTPHVTL